MKKVLTILTLIWAESTVAIRLVSSAPAITEFIFELGLGENLVGVSNYCNYPKDTLKIKKIGSALNLDYEMVIKLRPDWVFVQATDNEKIFESLEKLNLKFKKLDFDDFQGILKSYQELATILERKEKNIDFQNKVKNALEKLPRVTHSKNYIAVVNSQISFNAIKTIRLVGKGTYFDDILKLAGLHNLVQKSYPSVIWDRERIIKANPDRIFLIFSGHISKKIVQENLNIWKKLKMINAIKNEKINAIHGDFAVVPGPRIIELIKQFGYLLSL